MGLRSKILAVAYKLFPFSLRGDAQIEDETAEVDISCVINFYGRTSSLKNILCSLSEQDLPKERFEVILVEDRGGTEDGNELSKVFKSRLNVKYFPLRGNYGKMGYSRNFGLSRAKGRFILFLDDDTVILQKDFLASVIDEFENYNADAIIPRGRPSYCLLKGKYDFHDPYYPTNRCLVYRREVLGALYGFVSEITGQEDVEFVVRFIASGRSYRRSQRLYYFHPPLVVRSLNKAAAVGKSFSELKRRYPLIIWVMLLLNGTRFLPFLLFPINEKRRMQGRFSLGFLLGIVYSIIGKKIEYN